MSSMIAASVETKMNIGMGGKSFNIFPGRINKFPIKQTVCANGDNVIGLFSQRK